MDALFDEVKNLSRSRQIVDKFRKAIADGSLCIGDKLPPERELCVQLGVSRTSLREAVRILDAYGMVESTPGGGTYVTDRFSENVFEFLGFGNNLTMRNFEYILHTRMVIETGAVDRALESADAAGIERLQNLVDELEKESDFERLGFLDARFHESYIELAGNPILTTFYRMIFKILLKGTSQVITFPTARGVALEDHRRILVAVRRKDKPACADLIRRHLEHTEELISKYLKEEA